MEDKNKPSMRTLNDVLNAALRMQNQKTDPDAYYKAKALQPTIGWDLNPPPLDPKKDGYWAHGIKPGFFEDTTLNPYVAEWIPTQPTTYGGPNTFQEAWLQFFVVHDNAMRLKESSIIPGWLSRRNPTRTDRTDMREEPFPEFTPRDIQTAKIGKLSDGNYITIKDVELMMNVPDKADKAYTKLGQVAKERNTDVDKLIIGFMWALSPDPITGYTRLTWPSADRMTPPMGSNGGWPNIHNMAKIAGYANEWYEIHKNAKYLPYKWEVPCSMRPTTIEEQARTEWANYNFYPSEITGDYSPEPLSKDQTMVPWKNNQEF
jgi:hypothetical protein